MIVTEDVTRFHASERTFPLTVSMVMSKVWIVKIGVFEDRMGSQGALHSSDEHLSPRTVCPGRWALDELRG